MQLAIPLGASLAMSGLGSLLGRANPTATEQTVLNKDTAAQNTAVNTGQNLLGMGTNAVQQPLNYWSSILSGNRGVMTSALAPEISRIGQGYQTAAQTSSALMPRGGPRADVLSGMPYQQQRDVSTLFQTARPQAAAQLGSMGNSLLSGGIGALNAGTSAGNSILQQQEQQKQLEAQRGSSIGSGLFSMYQKYGPQPGQSFSDWLHNVKPQSAQSGGNV